MREKKTRPTLHGTDVPLSYTQQEIKDPGNVADEFNHSFGQSLKI
jgi:hypothetical protein